MPDTPVLGLRDLHVEYPPPRGLFSRGPRRVAAVAGINLIVPARSTVGIVGLLRPSGGQVLLNGVDLGTA
jgi:hypothetical protein